MIHTRKLLLAITLATSIAVPSMAKAAETKGTPPVQPSWSFAGLFGTYDRNQLQRGFQVFKEVCAACHSANLLAFRNLSEEGGPGYSEEQIKLLASEYTVQDPEATDGERSAISADHWPAPFASEQDARDANNGAYPPDFSVLAKARTISQPFPFWAFNYFTGYQEGGVDFIYNVLTTYKDEPPHGVTLADGQYYVGFLGTGIAMPPPLFDGAVEYSDPNVPQTVDQYAKDVSAFMMWVAEPHLVSRKELGFKVLIVLVLFAGLMYLTKRKLWARIPH